MTQEEYKIISTKCPVLNNDFNRNVYSEGAPTEVLVRLKNNEPIDVICPKYEDKGRCECRIKEDSNANHPLSKCIYSIGWRPLK